MGVRVPVEEAKKRCPANATTPEGWAELRKCIAKAKGEIINEKDPRIAKRCEKYSGNERDNCVDYTYIKGTSAPAYNSIRYRAYLEEHCAGGGCLGGGAPGERAKPSNAPEHTPGGVTGGRNTSHATSSDPRSNQSTITGNTGTNTISSGGHTNKINRPAFLGGGSRPQGVVVNGEAVKKDGTLNTGSDVLKIESGRSK